MIIGIKRKRISLNVYIKIRIFFIVMVLKLNNGDLYIQLTTDPNSSFANDAGMHFRRPL